MAVHMYTFCAKDSIFFLFRRANLFLPARRYAKNYKMPIEEKKAYLEFKRELREHRKKYMNESLELDKQEKELQMEFAKMDEMGKKASEGVIKAANLKVEHKRKAIEKADMKNDQKRREMGELSRLKIEKEIKHLHTKEIEAAVVESKEFITFENMNKKIDEALANIHVSTFALDGMGRRLFTANIYSPNALK